MARNIFLLLSLLIFACFFFTLTHAVPRGPFANGIIRPGAKYCPYCDSSVYGYCSDKLLHDACCCLDSYEQNLPRECRVADCSFLHANTCQEHSLITACCCSNIYLKK